MSGGAVTDRNMKGDKHMTTTIFYPLLPTPFQVTKMNHARLQVHWSLPTVARCCGRIAGCAFSVLLAACAAGPDFHAPAAPAATSYTPEPLTATTAAAGIAGGEAQHFVRGMDIPAQWWTLFASAPLNAVIARALQANPDLQSAQAALRAAQENVLAQQGAYYPAVNAGLAPSRQRSDPTLPPYTLRTAQVSVSYTFDAFGGNRRQVENLQALAEAQGYQLQAAYLSLTANVVAAVVQEASLRDQITAANDIIRLQQELLTLLQRQYGLGDVAQADLLAQRTALAQSQASLPPLQKALSQQRNLLAALTGNLPADGVTETFDLSALQLPQQLPLSLPSQLVEQRPDIRYASAQLHAASAAVGVATANMLPQITLSASAGSAAAGFGSLFAPGTGIWGVVGGLTQPLFAGGTLLHRKRAAEALLDQAAAQYRSTVITAFQNVADSLRALQYDAEVLRTQLQAERSAAASLAVARRAVALGAVTPQTLLNAEQSYQLTRIALVQAQASRYADTAALFQAMGGGWWKAAGSRQQAAGTVRE